MPAYDPETLVREILKLKRAGITRAALPAGAPSWKDLMDLTWEEIEDGARTNRAGYRTVRKLLTDSRFDR